MSWIFFLLFSTVIAVEISQITRAKACWTSLNCCYPVAIPSTSLSALVENDEGFNISSPYDDPVESAYYESNISKLPDVQAGGYDYTVTYYPDFSKVAELPFDTKIRLLKLHGAGYGVVVTSGSKVLLSDSGMWRTRVIDVTNVDLDTIAITTTTPPYPGLVTSNCPVSPPEGAPHCGQGGDHVLARNAGAMQFAAGWDWAQGIPDRVTGLFDKVEIITAGEIRVEAGSLRTRSTIGLVDVVYRLVGEVEREGTARLTITYKGEEVVNQEMGVVGGTGGDLLFSGVEIPSVELWWPHTMGSQPLYDVQVSFLDESLSWKAGVRTVETYIDENTEGRGFKVNGVEFFVQGGNWIATDAMLQRGSDERYGSEVMLHKFNGLNLIRVWGGGLPERPGFYRACDELGVMVFQEFWMSGDNNGRWGGEYDYPDDKEAYLEMVEDTVLRLREHTSLMFWGGGNELWPKGKSPPPVIASGLSGLISSYDDRFLIMSSMDGGYDGLDMSQHDDDFALAVKDGPYGFLDIQVYYDQPNPGMLNGSSVIVSFQPEVGGSSMVTMEGLKRMGLADVGFPSKFDQDVPELWDYHKFQGYEYTGQGGGKRDAVWDYGEPKSVEEYVRRAQMACVQQYQALFDGFTLKMFGPSEGGGKTAIIVWKSQTPWPSLRGFMYDWWLEGVGMGEGVRAGTGGEGEAVKVGINLGEGGGVTVVNRGKDRVEGGRVRAQAYTFEGKEVGSGVEVDVGGVEGGEVKDVGGTLVEGWKRGLEEVGRTVLVRVEGLGVRSWYWLKREGGKWRMNYEDMGEWEGGGEVEGTVGEGMMMGGMGGGWWEGKIKVKVVGVGCLVRPTFKGFGEGGGRLLPLMVGSDLVLLNDGKEVEWLVRAREKVDVIEVEGWGGATGVLRGK